MDEIQYLGDSDSLSPLLPDGNDNARSSSSEEAKFKRQAIIQELFESEQQYISDLTLIVEKYMEELSNIQLTESQLKNYKLIFGNIPVILEFHKTSFVKEIEKSLANYETAGLAFIKYDRRLYTYYASKYCLNKPKSDFIISQEHAKQFFNEIYLRKFGGNEKKKLSNLLMEPIQRIKKYQRFLNDIRKYTELAGDSIDALDKGLEVINHNSKKCDDMIELGRLTNMGGSLNSLGFLAFHGFLQISENVPSQFFKGKESIIFIFENSCVIADVIPKMNESSLPIYDFKVQIMANNLSFEEVPYEPLRFILRSNYPRQQAAFLCQTKNNRNHSVNAKFKHIDPRNREYRARLINGKYEVVSFDRKNQLNPEDEAIQKLENAKYRPVLFSLITNYDHDGSFDDDCPLPGLALAFKAKEFLHIVEKYNNNWWIGRLVKEDEVTRIYDLARRMNLLILDCDTINHPKQLAKPSLAPIFVYIKISSPKVIKTRGKSQTRNMRAQIVAHKKLLQCPQEMFEIILDDSQSVTAYEQIAVYLESYWRATHPDVEYPEQQPSQSTEYSRRLQLFVDELNTRICQYRSSTIPGPSQRTPK